MWNLDGVTITDMAAIGASTTYFDFNVFEEVQFTTGGLDPRQQTGGLGINLVSKRGSNALSAAGRTYFSNDDLQGENISESAEGRRPGGQSDSANSANTGPTRADRCGPIASGSGPASPGPMCARLRSTGIPMKAISRLWLPEETRKSARRHGSRFSTIAPKSRRRAGSRARIGRRKRRWNQGGATHISKAEVSRVFGPSLFLSAKFAYVDVGFGLTPKAGLDGQAYLDFAAGMWHGGYTYLEERSGTVSDANRRQLGARPSRSEIRPPSSADVVGRHGLVGLAMARETIDQCRGLGLPTGVGIRQYHAPVGGRDGDRYGGRLRG